MKTLTYQGQTLTLKQWAAKFELPYGLIIQRLSRKCPLDQVFSLKRQNSSTALSKKERQEFLNSAKYNYSLSDANLTAVENATLIGCSLDTYYHASRLLGLPYRKTNKWDKSNSMPLDFDNPIYGFAWDNVSTI